MGVPWTVQEKMQELESRVVTGAADTAELNQARAHVVSLEAQLSQMTKAGEAAELDLKGTPSVCSTELSARMEATLWAHCLRLPQRFFPTTPPMVLRPILSRSVS
jgi:hypothetical protein